jgi:hypothetical protein
MTTRYFALGMFLLLLAACSDDDDTKDRTREEFCRDWAEAACSEEAVSACQATDAEDCRQSQEDFCRDLVPADFSDEQGQACIDAVGDAYEDGDLEGDELATVLKLGPPCDKIIRGDQGRGEECDSTRDCDAAAGFECVRKSDSEEGTCQIPERIGDGRDCSAAQATCNVGFYCNGDNCVEAKGAGGSCTIPEECGEDAFCNDGTCEERAGVNETCTSDQQCLEGICFDFEGERTCTDRIRLARAEPVCDDLR